MMETVLSLLTWFYFPVTEQAREFLLIVRVLKCGISSSHLKDGQRDLFSRMSAEQPWKKKEQGKLGF